MTFADIALRVAGLLIGGGIAGLLYYNFAPSDPYEPGGPKWGKH